MWRLAAQARSLRLAVDRAGAASADIAVVLLTPGAIANENWPRLADLLDADERRRARRFAHDRDRRLYVAAHALKRLMLSAYAGGAPQDWRFETAPGGKPRLVGGQTPHFNLSHCEGLVACAVSRVAAVGIDVETVRHPAPFELVSGHFAPAERLWLSGLEAARRDIGFFRLWTLKEAVLKASGDGLALPLRDLDIGFAPLRVRFCHAALGPPAEWRLFQQTTGQAHVFALAWQGPASLSVALVHATIG